MENEINEIFGECYSIEVIKKQYEYEKEKTMNNNQLKIKLVIVGDTTTSKTSLTGRFVDNTFRGDEHPTIGASFTTKLVSLDRNTVKIIFVCFSFLFLF